MQKDKLSKILKTQMCMQRQLTPLFEASRLFSESLKSIQTAESNLLRENLFRCSIAPSAELRLLQANMNLGPEFRQQLEQMNRQLLEFKKGFILPETLTPTHLIQQSTQDLLAGILKRYQIQMSELESPLKKNDYSVAR